MNNYLIILMGFLTGLVDSVVGGGGLISLPTLSIALSPGAHAIGTNKIVGTVAASIALFVYTKKGFMKWKDGLSFCAVCMLGSFMGSSLAPFVSKFYFRYLMILMCPVILWIIYNKDKFFKEPEIFIKPHRGLFFLSAICSGFYDGIIGPGGGTFMFLGLFLGAGYPLLTAIAISKLANTLSAGTALVNFSLNGLIHWSEGLMMSVGVAVGAFIGATYASSAAAKIIRPCLIFIVTSLMLKLIWFS